MNPRIILGIDPGNARCGWGVLDAAGGRLALVDSGCLTTPVRMESGQRLLHIYDGICGLIQTYKPDELAIEKLYFNRNITSAMAVSEARGVVLLAATQCGVPISQYTPSQIKEVMTGKGTANKDEVRLMVMTALNLTKKPSPDDVSDAIAIAITHSFMRDLKLV